MQLDLDISDLRNMQFFGKNLNPFLRLWIGERVVPTFSPKSRISGFLACLNPPEESLESQIYAIMVYLDLQRSSGARFTTGQKTGALSAPTPHACRFELFE
jgi:hypothetical protein